MQTCMVIFYIAVWRVAGLTSIMVQIREVKNMFWGKYRCLEEIPNDDRDYEIRLKNTRSSSLNFFRFKLFQFRVGMSVEFYR